MSVFVQARFVCVNHDDEICTINWRLSVRQLCSHKPRFKVFAHLFQKAAQSRARSPCRCLRTAKLLLSFKKGRRGELSCQSTSRGEPTRSEGFSLLVYRYFIQYKGRAPHPPRSSAPSPRGKAKSAPFHPYKPTDKSKFERQIGVCLCVEICFPKPSPVGKVAIAFTK